jgi:DNA-binding response OmpR family regulator
MTLESAQILVVDDEAVVRRVLGDALSQAGHRVRLAASTREALALLEQSLADLMLLDLQLGDEDGTDLLRAARARWPQLPILILTAHGSLASAIEAVRHDAADYLLKPIGVEALRTRVAEVLARHRASQQRQERIRHMYHQLQALVSDEGLLPARPAAESAGESYSAGPLTLDVQRHQVRMSGHLVELTPTEFAILHTLVRQAGSVVPCAQLIQSFQNVTMDEDEARQVMRPHIVRLRRKLEPTPQTPLYLQAVRGIGYRWNAAGEGGDDE